MATTLPRALIEIKYEKAAQDYLRSLPLEHFMEAMPQATQRKITLESMDLLKKRRPDVQTFNELLVQYPLARQQNLGQVLPDNMVVLSEELTPRGASTCRSKQRVPFGSWSTCRRRLLAMITRTPCRRTPGAARRSRA